MRLTHVRLLVDDYAACFAFYRDLLGFEPTFGDESGDQLAAHNHGSGDAMLLIFGVEDVDDSVEALRTRGVPIVHQPVDKPEWGIRVAYIRDPDGNLIELNHSLPAVQ